MSRVRALAPGVKDVVQHIGPRADISAETSAPRWHEKPQRQRSAGGSRAGGTEGVCQTVPVCAECQVCAPWLVTVSAGRAGGSVLEGEPEPAGFPPGRRPSGEPLTEKTHRHHLFPVSHTATFPSCQQRLGSPSPGVGRRAGPLCVSLGCETRE